MSARPGRNDPCPCGSGKKFKRCCVDSPEQTPPAGRVLRRPDLERFERAATLHAMDGALVERVMIFGDSVVGWAPEEDFAMDLGEEPFARMLFFPWAAYEHRELDGRSMAEIFLEEHEASLSVLEKEWLRAQSRSWLSAWEVVEATPGVGLRLRDVLTNQERSVVERKGSQSLSRLDTILARVVDFDGLSVLCGMHGRALEPREAARFVDMVRQDLRKRKSASVSPSELREPGSAALLVEAWEEVLDERARLPPPRLQNTDGEAIVLIRDTYAMEPGASPDRVREALLGLPHAVDHDDEIALIRDNPPGSQLANTILGKIEIGAREIVVDVNSAERAASLRAQIDQACRGLVSFAKREEQDQSVLIAKIMSEQIEASKNERARPGSLRSAPPELAADLRGLKERSYRAWCDQESPALDGKTPRQAARSRRKQARDDLELLLKEIEHREGLAPADERFDVDILRRELGLRPPRAQQLELPAGE